MITKLNYEDKSIKSYAIRKLTPFECFRLMGIRDDVIKVMQTKKKVVKKVLNKETGVKEEKELEEMVISQSQQYKQAGNSIVVDVLKYIYEQLWYPKNVETKKELPTLFDMLFMEDNLKAAPSNQSHGKKLVLTTFSGYDSQLLACDALKEDHPDFQWECVGWSEIDKYAIDMHNLIFPEYADKALGDITKIDWHKVRDSLNGEQIDLFTFSSPCTDISQAGKQMGLKQGSGTRSALLWNVADAIEVLHPKYLLQENVAALISQKFLPDFKLWLKRLEDLGYINMYAKLNSKNFGIPQNRDRVFCISMRRDVAFDYKFPEGFELTKKLEDILEDETDQKFFLNDDSVSKYLNANNEDKAIFSQFNMDATHENAMFLKTYLQQLMNENNGWDFAPVELENFISSKKEEFYGFFNEWLTHGTFPSPSFETIYAINLNNK